MDNLHQKKFYSSPGVNVIIGKHAAQRGWGFSKALRHIVLDWAGALERVPKVGKIDPDGTITFSSREYAEYIRDFPNTIDPRD